MERAPDKFAPGLGIETKELMQMTLRAAFLIGAGAVIFHLSFWVACLLLIGYGVFALIDQWLAKRAKEKVVEDEIYGWEQDKDDPEHENKGNLTRLKLTGKEQIIVTRVAGILRRIP